MPRYEFILALIALALSCTAAALPSSNGTSSCKVETQPNPLVKSYPNDVTAVRNQTLAVVPIPLKVARAAIPSQYKILTNVYQALLPNFPKDMYPLLFESGVTNDIQSPLAKPEAFSRVGFLYPFVDRLNDGYSSFVFFPRYGVTGSNIVALGGVSLLTPAVALDFQPSCNPYERQRDGSTTLRAMKDGALAMSQVFSKESKSTYSLAFWKNVTNQARFGTNPFLCDNTIQLWNTSITQGRFAPVPITGSVYASKALYEQQSNFTGTHGLHVALAFIERFALDCRTLQGFQYKD